MTEMAVASVSSANVIALIQASGVLVAILAAGFSVVGLVAVWRAGHRGEQAYFHMIERLQVLQLVTVMLVIASATVLALLGIIDANGIIGILSGVGGYVLGGLNRAPATGGAIVPPAAGDVDGVEKDQANAGTP